MIYLTKKELEELKKSRDCITFTEFCAKAYKGRISRVKDICSGCFWNRSTDDDYVCRIEEVIVSVPRPVTMRFKQIIDIVIEQQENIIKNIALIKKL